MLEPITLPSPYVLVDGLSPSQLDEVCRWRVVAWKRQATIREDMVQWGPDSFDLSGRHWAILLDGRIVAAIRLTFHNNLSEIPAAHCFKGVVPEPQLAPIASYNRLVVHPDHRGRGLAKALDVCCINAAEMAGATILLGATGHVPGQKSRIDAMVSLGFTILGPSAVLDVDLIHIMADQRLSTVLAYFFRR
jgi:GNAT superfamily N-acetyltransferase